MADYDVIVVGSGFGGGAAACRLSEAGARVLVLERGRHWTPGSFPRTISDPWFFDHSDPACASGWLDLRFFRGMMVAQGAGVGGGSLSYASVTMRADAERFAEGWPAEVNADSLAPFYDLAERMMNVGQVPEGQETHRSAILRRAADKLGYADRYERVPLAVTFDPDYSYNLPDPVSAKHAKSFINEQGSAQATCAHLGNCHVGCEVLAKNTVDLTYLARAQAQGAEVRALHSVRSVEPEGQGYRVRWHCTAEASDGPGSATADRVVLAAGSLGTTELLLRCREEHKTLPNVSQRLGQGWSPNANFMTPAFYPDDVEVNQGVGPLIGSGLTFMDGSFRGQRFYIADDGFPNLLLNALRDRWKGTWLGRKLAEKFARGLDEFNPTDRLMLWLGEGVDAGNGRLRLGRVWYKPWRTALKLDWDVKASLGVYDAIIAMQEQLSAAGGAKASVPPQWRWFKWGASVHPLGGCNMAADASAGVVDHRGEVFGYPNLFIADGSVIPRPIGRNPALTIAALGERTGALIAREMTATETAA